MFFTPARQDPKIATHSFKYPLGHFITAKYWHCAYPVRPAFYHIGHRLGQGALGQALRQWLCESAVFVYDFERFEADDILPLFAEYNITTFCAPPTMYRFFIKAGSIQI
jgi:acetyl-CoA synthetase